MAGYRTLSRTETSIALTSFGQRSLSIALLSGIATGPRWQPLSPTPRPQQALQLNHLRLLEQLKKASKYQKSNRKMKCILILSTSLIFLLFLLILLKS